MRPGVKRMLSAVEVHRHRDEPRRAGRTAKVLRWLAPIGRSTWCAASGRRTRHTIYSLIGCPPVASAVYLLIRRDAGGAPRVLAVRRTRSRFPSLNLARIRRAGARLGANEVHLHDAARTDDEQAAILADLLRSAREVPRATSSGSRSRR